MYLKLKKISLDLIVPVYNESQSIQPFVKAINNIFKNYNNIVINLIFINDGSIDKTLLTLLNLKKKFKNITIINFSRNFGKEAALTAGLHMSNSQVAVIMDVDLQDPPELIVEMIQIWNKGFDVVLAKRVDRSSDTFTKRITSKLFYKIHNLLADIQIPENVGDFRLIDKKVVKAINTLNEYNRFMKGILSWVGFKTFIIEYKRNKRFIGATKFNYLKLLKLGLDGVFSFSLTPLRISLFFGFFIASISFIYLSIIVLKKIMYGISAPGYASIISCILFFSGIQMISIGILGEYLGRNYTESKRRPLYIIDNIL